MNPSAHELPIYLLTSDEQCCNPNLDSTSFSGASGNINSVGNMAAAGHAGRGRGKLSVCDHNSIFF